MKRLTDIRHLVIDMDGVLYVGNQPMPCLAEFIAFLRDAWGRSVSPTSEK